MLHITFEFSSLGLAVRNGVNCVGELTVSPAHHVSSLRDDARRAAYQLVGDNSLFLLRSASAVSMEAPSTKLECSSSKLAKRALRFPCFSNFGLNRWQSPFAKQTGKGKRRSLFIPVSLHP